MSKTETLRQSAAQSNEKRLEYLADQIEMVRQTKHKNAEDLAAMLEPLAQAMAALTDETRQTLEQIRRESAEALRNEHEALKETKATLTLAVKDANEALERVRKTSQHLSLKHYALTMLAALITAVAVSGFWLWLSPPTVKNSLDAEAVAKYLKPAIEALKLSKGR